MKRLCAQSAHDAKAAQASPRFLLALLLLVFVPLSIQAGAPQWWSDRGVIDPQATANDYAAINQGQLKNLAVKAHAELRQRLPASVWVTTQGAALDDLIAVLQTTTNSQFNYSAVNIGQLKNVARPFYDVLMLPSVRFATSYPWANSATPANDFAMANIGQAKNLFAFEFSTFDADGNGISDIWEMQYFGRTGINPSADPDRDSVSNLQEFQNGSSPNDYYNGVLPTVVITGGDGQRSSAGVVLTTPLKVKVTKVDSSAWANAPVSFTVLSGGGSVALTTSSVPVSATSYTLLTDANGEAQIYFRQPAQTGVISYIQATVGGAAPVIFTERSGLEMGYWKLDETTGTTAADASISGNPAILNGAPTWLPTTGRLNGALLLNSTNDFGRLNSAAPVDITGDLSISVWIQVDTSETLINPYTRIVSKKGEWNGVGGYEIEYNAVLKRLCFAGQGQDQLLAYNTDLNSGWHHIVATLRKKTNSPNSEPKLYVDGVEKIKNTTISSTQSGVYITNHTPGYSFKTDQSFSPLISSTASLAIGRNGQIPGQPTPNGVDNFVGLIDDVRIFDYALTSEEIVKLFRDSDGDGIADNWELQWFGNLSTADAASDFDGDKITDLHEYLQGTDPKVLTDDEDGDGVANSYELNGPQIPYSLKVSIIKTLSISDTFEFINGTFKMTSFQGGISSCKISIDNGSGTENYIPWDGGAIEVDALDKSVVREGLGISATGCTSGVFPYQFPKGHDYNGSGEYTVNVDPGGVPGSARIKAYLNRTSPAASPYTYEFRFNWSAPDQGAYSDWDVADTDQDGLIDGDELFLSHTNAKDPDTDHDGMPDGWEYHYGLNPNDPSDANLDPDQDGLTNLVEYQFDSDPLLADGERNAQGVPVGDGMPDKYEVYQGLAPRRNDSGYVSLYRNGLSRLEQMLSAVNDTDLDGLSNVAEAVLGTNPTNVDTDGDGMPDGWEVLNKLNPKSKPDESDAALDPDADSYANHYLNGGNPSTFTHTNRQEFDAKTLPYHYDSDNDGLGDRWELMYGTNPLSFCENLIAWYRLEESGEYLLDYSGHNLDGHAYGVTSVAGVTGGSDTQARQFGVISTSQPLENHSYLLVRHDDRLIPAEGITIAFWFKPTQDLPAWESDLVTKAGSYNLTYGTDGKLTYTLITGVVGSTTASTTVTSTVSISSAQWNHVALTYDKPTGRQTLYINGTTSSSTLGIANSPIAIPADTLAAPLIIGSVRKIPCRTPQCSIDDIRIYKGALPPGAPSSTPVSATDGATIYRLAHPGDPTLEPNRDDWDHDGLTNLEEYRLGTDPQNADTDGDSFTDGDEVHGITVTVNGVPRTYYSNPRLTDSDGDRISDYNENHGLDAAGNVAYYGPPDHRVACGPTDPKKTDTDNDGLFDNEELTIYHTNPNNIDTDGDGMPDGWELLYNLNPLDPSDAAKGAASDKNSSDYLDGDSLTNLQEYYAGTNPRAYDSSAGINIDLATDTDNDGLTDYVEKSIYKTDPANPDTIGDGLGDFFRAMNGMLEYDANDNLIGANNASALQPENQAGGNPDNDTANNSAEQAANTNPNDDENYTAIALGETPITQRKIDEETISPGQIPKPPTIETYGSSTVTIKVPEGSSVYLAQSKTEQTIHVQDFLKVNTHKRSASGIAKPNMDPTKHIGASPRSVYNFAGAISITDIAEATPVTADNMRTFTIERCYVHVKKVKIKEDDDDDDDDEEDDGGSDGDSDGGQGWHGPGSWGKYWGGGWWGLGWGGGGGSGENGWSESESSEPETPPEPEHDETDEEKNKSVYSSSAIWVIVVPGIQKPELKTTSIEAPSTDLTEEKENNPGAYTLKRQKADDPAPTTKIRLTAMKMDRPGATRKLKWDPKQLVIVGQENNSEGTLEISESAGEKTFQAYGHEKMTGSATVSLTATTSGGIYMGEDTIVVNLISSELVPDYNHDGMIDDNDRNKVTDNSPWRFWLNDNDDNGDIEGSDIPGDGQNGMSPHVDGLRDLVDFFPLYLDIKAMLKILPPDQYDYTLSQPEVALRYIYTDLTINDVRKHHHDQEMANELKAASTNPTYAGGSQAKLTTNFLNKILNEDGKGVLLLEAQFASDKPLSLKVSKGGSQIVETKLYMKVDSVEKMYRSLNLLSSNGQSGGLATQMGEPSNYPDQLCNNKNFVYVHGYNVNPQQARGIFNAMFKRLWASGSRAKFTGVTWYGSESQGLVPLLSDVTPDYQANVLNAFSSASALKNELKALNGSITIAAHSLGNMVVGSAMQDWGFKADHYYMIDAAVAKECYDGTEDQTYIMSDPTWEQYDSQLRSTNWHKLPWSNGDWRAKLTWENRLVNVSNAYNFYSTGEEVLKNPPHGTQSMPTSAELVWAAQEKRKGYGLTGYILTSVYGGWDYNPHPDYMKITVNPLTGDTTYFPKTQAELGPVDAVFKEKLKTLPFFDPGVYSVAGEATPGAPSDIRTLYGSDGSAYASPERNRNTLLAQLVPVHSTAAGSNPVSRFPGIDMNSSEVKVNGWPYLDGRWHHSDITKAAYFYTYVIFDKFVSLGGLDK